MLFLPYLWQGIELEELWLEGLSLHGLLVLCSYWGLKRSLQMWLEGLSLLACCSYLTSGRVKEEVFVDEVGRTKLDSQVVGHLVGVTCQRRKTFVRMNVLAFAYMYIYILAYLLQLGFPFYAKWVFCPEENQLLFSIHIHHPVSKCQKNYHKICWDDTFQLLWVPKHVPACPTWTWNLSSFFFLFSFFTIQRTIC